MGDKMSEKKYEFEENKNWCVCKICGLRFSPDAKAQRIKCPNGC